MKKSVVWILSIAMVTLFAGQAQAAYIDLTTVDSSGTLVGVPGGTAVFQQGSDNAGTGIFPSFVQIEGSGAGDIKQGFNTTVNGVLNTASSDIHNHEITVGQLTTVNIGGTLYYQFFLDVNENNNAEDRYVSLDDLVVLTSSTANTGTCGAAATACTDANFLPTGGTVVWNMQPGDGVLLDFNLEPGSGYADMTFNVPVSAFGGASSSTFVYLYSKFGVLGEVTVGGVTRDFGTSDGFEEWAFMLGESTTVPDGGSTLGLLGIALLGLGYARRRFAR